MNSKDTKEARELAEAKLKRKEVQARDSAQAWKDYEAERLAVSRRTAQLRELRLAKEAADKARQDAEPPKADAKPTSAPKKRVRRASTPARRAG